MECHGYPFLVDFMSSWDVHLVQTSMGCTRHKEDLHVDPSVQGIMLGDAYEEMEDATLVTRSTAYGIC